MTIFLSIQRCSMNTIQSVTHPAGWGLSRLAKEECFDWEWHTSRRNLTLHLKSAVESAIRFLYPWWHYGCVADRKLGFEFKPNHTLRWDLQNLPPPLLMWIISCVFFLTHVTWGRVTFTAFSFFLYGLWNVLVYPLTNRWLNQQGFLYSLSSFAAVLSCNKGISGHHFIQIRIKNVTSPFSKLIFITFRRLPRLLMLHFAQELSCFVVTAILHIWQHHTSQMFTKMYATVCLDENLTKSLEIR